MAVTSRCTDYRCSEGHDWYSYSTVPVTVCPYPRCNGVVTAVRGWLVKQGKP